MKKRLESNQGISYGEFSYQLLQAYDFLYLNQNHNVSVQIGGNDQWGNITLGIELINKINRQKNQTNLPICRRKPYGITVPLLLKNNGEKIGKSLGNAIWLSSDMTTPYELYQFFLQTSDETVEKYLKIFTLLPLDTVFEIIRHHFNNPSQRYAQHRLAEEVVMLVHGQEEMEKSKIAAQLLFLNKEENKELKISQILHVLSNKDIITLNRNDVIGTTVPKIIQKIGISSKSQINKLMRGGGIYNNGKKITNLMAQITEDWLTDGKFLILKLGKKRHIIINII